MYLKDWFSGGKQVLLCESEDGAINVNGSRCTLNDTITAIEELEPAYASEYIEQHGYANEIFPKSTNTIRIVTMVDPDTQKPFIPIAVHRIGTSGTGSVDNWSAGGLSAEVDVENGELSEAAQLDNGLLRWHDTHPDTNNTISGKVIPRWDEVTETILKIILNRPHLQYVGFDVVVTDDSLKIVEANGNMDVDVLQVHRPLLSDDRVRRFYRHHGVI